MDGEQYDHAGELARVAVRLRQRQARASLIWEHQQLCKRLVEKGEISQEQCDWIIALSGGEIVRG